MAPTTSKTLKDLLIAKFLPIFQLAKQWIMRLTAILLNDSVTFGTVFGVGRDPVGSLGVVLTLLAPLSQQIT